MVALSPETPWVSVPQPRHSGHDPSETELPTEGETPKPISVISEPLTSSDLLSGLFLLTDNADQIEIAPGVLGVNPVALSKYPNGLAALEGNDSVRGSTDSEQIMGNQGQDTLEGQGGDDTLRGGQEFDLLYGGVGNDLLNGNLGDDYVYGNEGNDLLRGGQGNDALVGEAGNDTLIGDMGLDRLWGGEGADVFVLRTDTATPAMSDALPSDNGVGDVDTISADFILDYNAAQGDVIGLTKGLTVNDLVITQETLTYGDRRDYQSSGPFPLDQIRTADFQIETVSVTVMTIAETGNILGLVKGVSPGQLQFVSVDHNILGKG